MIEKTKKGPGKAPTRTMLSIGDKPLQDIVIAKSGELPVEEGGFHVEDGGAHVEL